MNPDRLYFNEYDGERLRFVTDPQAGADAWANSAGAAQTKFVDGVNKTTVDVVGRAIAQKNVLLQNFQHAITSGLWERRLSESGGTANWKAKTIAKANNFSTGIAAAKPAYLKAAQSLYPYIGAGQAQVDSMPKGSIADSKARATFWIDYMANYRANR